MFCEYCGKQIEDNSKFCPYCGKGVSLTDTGSFAESAVASSERIENNISNIKNEPIQGHEESEKGTNEMSNKTAKLILSFIIGVVLSFVTFLILTYVSFSWLIIGIMLWGGIGAIIYTVVLKLSNSNGIGGLCGVLGGGIGMWIVSGLLGRYFEAVELADTIFGAFLLLLPLTLVWTLIVYCIANAADK